MGVFAVYGFVLLIGLCLLPGWVAMWLLLRLLDRDKTPNPAPEEAYPVTLRDAFGPAIPEGHVRRDRNEAESAAVVSQFTEPLPSEESHRGLERHRWQGNLFSGKTADEIIAEDGWPVFPSVEKPEI